MVRPTPSSTLFPLPTLFRSWPREVSAAGEALAPAPTVTTAPADVLGFSRHSFSVSEADSVVQVNVRRLGGATGDMDRKSTRLNSSHSQISYAVFCLKKKNT